jgi:hypothetical protein
MFSILNSLARIAAAATVVTLASCGGGGSASGGLTEFSVTPSSWTLTFGKGNTTCALTGGFENPKILVTVVGGTPPYRIVNSSPGWLAVSQTNLSGKNPTFAISSTGGCGDALNVLILDSLSRSTTFTATTVAGEEITATTP